MVRLRSTGSSSPLHVEDVSWPRAVAMLGNEVELLTLSDGPNWMEPPSLSIVLNKWIGDFNVRRRNGFYIVTLYEPSREYEGHSDKYAQAVLDASRKAVAEWYR